MSNVEYRTDLFDKICRICLRTNMCWIGWFPGSKLLGRNVKIDVNSWRVLYSFFFISTPIDAQICWFDSRTQYPPGATCCWRVMVVVRLHHLEVGLLGVRGDRQSPANVLFFRLCFSLTINGVRGLDAFMTLKMSSFCLLLNVWVSTWLDKLLNWGCCPFTRTSV